MSTLLKTICTCTEIPITLTKTFVKELEQIIPKFVWNNKRPQTAKTNLKESKDGDITIPDFRLYYKAVLNITVWYQQTKTTKIQMQTSIEWKPRNEFTPI